MCTYQSPLPEAPGRQHADGKMDPAMFAYALISHLLDEHGEAAAESYLVRVVEEVVELEPGVRQHFSDALLAELKEEIAQREDPRFSHATITLIETIEDDWRSDG